MRGLRQEVPERLPVGETPTESSRKCVFTIGKFDKQEPGR